MAEKAVTKKESNLPVVQSSWGCENIDPSDVLIPRINLAQKMSEVTSADNPVQAGCFYRSTTKEAVSGPKKPLEILVISSFKNWIIEKWSGSKFEWEGAEPFESKDANLPWEYEENGEKKRRNQCLNYYVLLPEDLGKEKEARAAFEKGEVPDEFGETIPAVLSFRRTAYTCAKAINTYMTFMRDFKQPACTYVLEITTEEKENDLGKFFVPMMKKGRKATPEEIESCRRWYDIISKAEVQVDSEA